MFHAYMDESGSSESKLFTLSCIVGWGSEWFWIENAWERLLEKTNQRLIEQGRRRLSRYHAADCSSCLNEFSGWTREEQIELTTQIINIFRYHKVETMSYSINLKDLAEELPKTSSDPYGFAYFLLLRYLMIEIGNRVLSRERYLRDRVALIHDRCPYDAALLKAFEQMKADPTFRFADRFTSIAPMSSQDCIPLQATDLVAYENFKEAESTLTKRKRRKTLEFLLGLKTFGGVGKTLGRQWMREYKKVLEDMDEGTKESIRHDGG